MDADAISSALPHSSGFLVQLSEPMTTTKKNQDLIRAYGQRARRNQNTKQDFQEETNHAFRVICSLHHKECVASVFFFFRLIMSLCEYAGVIYYCFYNRKTVGYSALSLKNVHDII